MPKNPEQTLDVPAISLELANLVTTGPQIDVAELLCNVLAGGEDVIPDWDAGSDVVEPS
jgi:hypothetical protein